MARTFDAEEEEELHSIFKGLKNGTGDNPNETTSSVYTGSNGITTVRVSVYLPFLQRDLFRELVRKSRPLDVDEESAANVEVVRPGRDRHMPTASEGYIRRTEYKNGIVMRHELVEVEIPSRLKWRILEIKRVPISLKGKSRTPDCTITLTPRGMGCAVEVIYTFERSTVMVPCCCLGPLVPDAIRTVLTRSLAVRWTNAMIDRGYANRFELMATRLQTWTKAMAERRNYRLNGSDDDRRSDVPRKTTPSRTLRQSCTLPQPATLPPPPGTPVPKPVPGMQSIADEEDLFYNTRGSMVTMDSSSDEDSDNKAPAAAYNA